MEDPTPPLDTAEVFRGLKTWLFEGPKSIGSLWALKWSKPPKKAQSPATQQVRSGCPSKTAEPSNRKPHPFQPVEPSFSPPPGGLGSLGPAGARGNSPRRPELDRGEAGRVLGYPHRSLFKGGFPELELTKTKPVEPRVP